MKPKLYHVILAAIIGWCGVSCNSDDNDSMPVIENTTLSNVEVSYFGLSSAPHMDANADTLFFSIDLAGGLIFNADSLPMGTVRSNAIVQLTVSSASRLEVLFTNAEGELTTVDYMQNPNDSVYFGNDDVKVRVVSADGNVQRDYQVKLNVHEKKPDSLYWDATPFAPMPTSLGAPSSQKTVEMEGKYYTLVSDGTSATMASTVNPADRQWSVSAVTLPADARIETLAAIDGKMYICADGLLYSSADAGATWTSTGARMDYIYGGYGTMVLGNRRNADFTYTHVTYPATTEKPVARGCPIGATSIAMVFSNQWSDNPLFTVLGGRTSDGSLTGSLWAFDGNEWANISLKALPPVEGVVMIPYYNVTFDIRYVASASPVLLAFGGNFVDGTLNDVVYMSVDQGVHWVEAPAYMQPGRNALRFTGSQAFVVEQTLRPEASRAVRPISSWQCPYIYVFGGYDLGGFLPVVQRGYINYFTFLPIQ